MYWVPFGITRHYHIDNLSQNVKVGDRVPMSAPGVKRSRGHWVGRIVERVRDDLSTVCNKVQELKTVAPKEVRTLPESDLRANTVRVQYLTRTTNHEKDALRVIEESGKTTKIALSKRSVRAQIGQN